MSFIQHFIIVHSIVKYAGSFPIIGNAQEALNLISRYRIKTEIIGTWLYCFTTPLIGYQLETIGFWFSFKHNAYIYSGFPKEEIAGDETLDEIRARLGSRLIK